MWNLETGLKLVRALDNQAQDYGFHLALGGSVLRKGESEKDVDLYFLPYDNPKFPEKLDELIAWLTRIWGTPTRIDIEYPKSERAPDGRIYGVAGNEAPPEGMRVRSRLTADGSQEYYWEPSPMARAPMGNKAKKSDRYQEKLKFTRSGGERIDVFIL